MLAIQTNRQRLVHLTNCQFIEPDDFINRATSRDSLQRADDAAAGVHGLLDPESGDYFVVEDEKLDGWQTAGSSPS